MMAGTGQSTFQNLGGLQGQNEQMSMGSNMSFSALSNSDSTAADGNGPESLIPDVLKVYDNTDTLGK